MRTAQEIPDSPPPELRFRARSRVLDTARGLWSAREVIVSLAERDIRARYKQSFLGLTWAVVQPLSLVFVLTFFARKVGSVASADVSYPVYAMTGLVVWGFFTSALSQGGLSLLTNSALLNKVYCPRQAFPVAGMLVAAVDGFVATLALVALFVINKEPVSLTALWIPLLLLVQIVFTAAVTLTFSAIVIYVRDLRNALPLALQFGLFATPIAYGMSSYGARSKQVLYSVLNPLGPVIDSYRRVLFHDVGPDWQLMLPAAASSVVLFTLALALFGRLERGFADVA